MKTYITIHSVVVNDVGEYLVLQRANHRSNPGSWNFITGYIQDRESAEEAALRELKEETNLEGEIVKTTNPFWIEEDNIRWVIIASLISMNDTSKLKIDEQESQSCRWIKVDDLLIKQFFPLRKTLGELGILSLGN